MSSKSKSSSIIPGLAAVGAAGLAAYWFIARPWHQKWGATVTESYRQMPGDALVPSAPWRTTHAVNIQAPIQEVWAWVVQMGQGRAGFYSYDWLENLFGMNIHNVNQLVPELQNLKVGDNIPFWRGTGITVRKVEPPNLLVLGGSLSEENAQVGGSWVFALSERFGGGTRLIVRTRSQYGPWWIAPFVCLIGEPAHFIMERAMLRGIKQRAEGMHSKSA